METCLPLTQVKLIVTLYVEGHNLYHMIMRVHTGVAQWPC